MQYISEYYLKHRMMKSFDMLLSSAITYTAEWMVLVLSYQDNSVWNDHPHFEWISKLAVHSFTLCFVTKNTLKDNMKGIPKMIGYLVTKHIIWFAKSALYLFDHRPSIFCEITLCLCQQASLSLDKRHWDIFHTKQSTRTCQPARGNSFRQYLVTICCKYMGHITQT